ncbi:MAG: hypothetical protein RBS17_04950 [Coriobacteriia bacterium]|nr:hypothetical protein [Coriobacteriia bacterium]
MRFPAVVEREVDPAAFITFWAQRYGYSAGEADYDSHVRHDDSGYQEADLIALMRWKAGAWHAARAEHFARQIPLDALNEFHAQPELSDSDLQGFYSRFAKPLTKTQYSIIWPIFVCHIARPDDVPIYDVNVWLAWLYIAGELREQHFAQTPRKFETYVEYRRFFIELVGISGATPRDTDKALMAFGQFLRTGLARTTLGL